MIEGGNIRCKLIDQGNVLLVDVRDTVELKATGKLRGAFHVPRGMLEFRADPKAPSHDPAFQKAKTVLVYCGSGMPPSPGKRFAISAIKRSTTPADSGSSRITGLRPSRLPLRRHPNGECRRADALPRHDTSPATRAARDERRSMPPRSDPSCRLAAGIPSRLRPDTCPEHNSR
jgi:Rhodanese-like domain